MKKPDVQHTEGPLVGVKSDDVLRVMAAGEEVAVMKVTRVKNFAIKGRKGETPCKITLVGGELRLYVEESPLRKLVWRNITFSKVDA